MKEKDLRRKAKEWGDNKWKIEGTKYFFDNSPSVILLILCCKTLKISVLYLN